MRDTPPGENAEFTGAIVGDDPDGADWPGMARAAYDASTNWMNASRRKGWSDSLRMFQGEHPTGSKYHGQDFRYRSRLFRPKARATVRKTEAATAAAFFANDQMTSIRPENEDDPKQQASAQLMQELLQIRLSKDIPWFVILSAARQDCEIYGICVSRQYWKYAERLIGTKRQAATDEFGDPLIGADGLAETEEFQYFEVVDDHPDIALIAPDNFRFDPACDWTRPVQTSPYLIERCAMFVGDIKEKMRSDEWRTYDDGAILGAKGVSDDSTRTQREANRQNSMDTSSSVRDFDVAWVHLNTIRWQGRDYVFFTLGADKLLTDPRPSVEVYGTERRPYRIGITNLEAHRNYPASKMELLRDLQSQANDSANLRLDALKLSLQPRPKVKVGTQAAQNMADFRVFMPGKPILVNAMDDVDWDRPPEISQASYLEQDRVNSDFDEIGGTFNQSSVATNRALNETVGGMELLAGAAGTIGEYELRLFVETWVRGVLEDLIDLEQRLEDDETILILAGARAQLVQKYGIDEVTDGLLSQRLTMKVNVGIGATNPATRITQFKTIAEMLVSMFGPAVGQGLNFDEVCSEVFGAFGFADGKRFFKEGFNIAEAQQQMKSQDGGGFGVDPTELEQVQIKANTDLQKTQMQTGSQERIAEMRWGGDTGETDPAKLTEAQIKAAAAMRQSAVHAASQERIAELRLQQEREKQGAETRRAEMQQQADMKGHVIRTLPPAMARLMVAKQQGDTSERLARLRPGGGA